MYDALRFELAGWSAWSPARRDAAAWLDWAAGADMPAEDDAAPALAAMPPLLRRRAHRVGRMALETLYQCNPDPEHTPIVYCSRHGESTRQVQLLQTLHQDTAVSAQQFSMAVHHAIAGLFTIARGSRVPVSALAAGRSTIWGGLVEALMQMAEGAAAVMLVQADEPLPEVYGAFADEAEQPYAYALVLRPGNRWQLRWSAADGEDIEPAACGVLRALLTGEAFDWCGQGRRWTLEPVA
ncbi:beta-ketoacyl synthase chain length factor [Chitiniphilus purpureus]|uniref:Beta-ketoacyl synthase chain length factor n=1 Tax=Chitiniphilus purpureus TaxID=2981137 RepID=A0ABY6DSF7_9NEIS|nr:beta-ketoacyl synthase chain length factor [Chitiniphilus sp. CD1]UXY16011.1 beta-ketoacyl synthase chain length factor [Chitiniphilus sp. CD1]